MLNAMTVDRAETAAIVARKHIALEPAVWSRFGPRGIRKCEEDAAYHLSFLAEAWLADDAALFSAYARWAAIVLASRNIPTKHLVANLRIIEEVLAASAEAIESERLHQYVASAINALDNVAVGTSYLEGNRFIDSIARQYLAALLATNRREAQKLVLEAISNGTTIRDLYLQVFERTQYEIGRLWQTNRITIAQEHYCTAATQSIIAQLYERLDISEPRKKTIVAICVSGELHDIGLRIVCDFLEMEGWDTVFCGANTPTADIITMLRVENAPVLAISATMTFHLSRVAEIVQAVKDSGVNAKIIVGGSPFRASPLLWQRIGADAFAENAAAAGAAITRIDS